MSFATLIRRMSDAGATPEAIALAVEAIEAVQSAETERKAKQAERKARQRERDKAGTVTGQSRDTAGTDLSPKKEIPPTPPKEKITPIPVSEARASSTERARGFSDFWAIYPHKVGKRDAEKAFASALQRASLEAILAGVRRYAAKTDDRPWCNPSTFLNQNRWEDEPAVPVPRSQAHSPPERTVSDVLGEMSAGTWTGPKDTNLHEPTLIDITSYSRFAR